MLVIWVYSGNIVKCLLMRLADFYQKMGDGVRSRKYMHLSNMPDSNILSFIKYGTFFRRYVVDYFDMIRDEKLDPTSIFRGKTRFMYN